MRLALWQGPSPEGDLNAAMTSLQTALKAAGAAGAVMLVAPEAYLPGYNQADIARHAQDQAGDWATTLADLCRTAKCGLTVGYAERAGNAVYNAAMAIGSAGKVLGHYRKIQLYGDRERAIYAPGDAYCTFDLDGVKAAILICYDIEFAPHVAALAAQGVKIILVPTANMQPFTHVVRATVPAMAANYGVSIVYANYCGVEGDLIYVGGSLIAASEGAVVAQAGRGSALIIADLPDVDAAHLSTQLGDYRAVQ
jgi:5-aminopentanamidase